MFQLFNCIFTVLDTKIEALSRFILPPVIWLLLYVYMYVIGAWGIVVVKALRC